MPSHSCLADSVEMLGLVTPAKTRWKILKGSKKWCPVILKDFLKDSERIKRVVCCSEKGQCKILKADPQQKCESLHQLWSDFGQPHDKRPRLAAVQGNCIGAVLQGQIPHSWRTWWKAGGSLGMLRTLQTQLLRSLGVSKYFKVWQVLIYTSYIFLQNVLIKSLDALIFWPIPKWEKLHKWKDTPSSLDGLFMFVSWKIPTKMDDSEVPFGYWT